MTISKESLLKHEEEKELYEYDVKPNQVIPMDDFEKVIRALSRDFLLIGEGETIYFKDTFTFLNDEFEVTLSLMNDGNRYNGELTITVNGELIPVNTVIKFTQYGSLIQRIFFDDVKGRVWVANKLSYSSIRPKFMSRLRDRIICTTELYGGYRHNDSLSRYDGNTRNVISVMVNDGEYFQVNGLGIMFHVKDTIKTKLGSLPIDLSLTNRLYKH